MFWLLTLLVVAFAAVWYYSKYASKDDAPGDDSGGD